MCCVFYLIWWVKTNEQWLWILRTRPLGSSSWRGWGLWNISWQNYLPRKQVLWGVLPDSQAWIALALLYWIGNCQRHFLIILISVCRQLRVIYPKEWSELGEKNMSWYGKVCFSQVNIFFKALKILKRNISVGCSFPWCHIIIQVLIVLVDIASSNQTKFCFISAMLFRQILSSCLLGKDLIMN